MNRRNILQIALKMIFVVIFNIIKTRHSIKTIKKYVNEIVSLLNPNSDNLDFSPNNFGANKNVT